MPSKRRPLSLKSHMFVLLTAAVFLLAFLGGGSQSPFITHALAALPPILAAYLLGTGQAIAIGLFYGAIGAVLISAHPTLELPASPYSAVALASAANALYGALLGWLFRLARGTDQERSWSDRIALIAPLFHALLRTVCLHLIAGTTSRIDHIGNVLNAECLVMCLIGLALAEAARKLRNSRWFVELGTYMDNVTAQRAAAPFDRCALVALLLTASIAIAWLTSRFSHRLFALFDARHVPLSDAAHSAIALMQVQFALAILSFITILGVLMLLQREYTACRNYRNRLDYLTRTMGRSLFVETCKHLACNPQSMPRGGWFAYIDIDYFKEINDVFGHPFGDRALQDVAHALVETFGDACYVGRMGGDEFAVMVCEDLEEGAMSALIERFQERITKELSAEMTLTCSVGACRFERPFSLSEVYAAADELLYRVKKNGRAGFELGRLSADGLVDLGA